MSQRHEAEKKSLVFLTIAQSAAVPPTGLAAAPLAVEDPTVKP
jgi:hypothetical protein